MSLEDEASQEFNLEIKAEEKAKQEALDLIELEQYTLDNLEMPNMIFGPQSEESEGINLPSVPANQLKEVISILERLDGEMPLIPSSGKSTVESLKLLFTVDFLGMTEESMRLCSQELIYSNEYTLFHSVR